MNFSNQFIFFISVLGAFNGLILATYAAVAAKRKRFSNYYLVLLLLAISVRIIKSSFFYLNPYLSGVFIQVGLSACILIGPFLYLYLNSITEQKKMLWQLHILPFLIGITVVGIIYPYVQNRHIWGPYIVRGIYLQWLIYVVLSFRLVKPTFQKLFAEKVKLLSFDIWLLSVFCGVAIICIAYNVGSYTSYLVGTLSFSFVLYLIVLLLLFRVRQTTFFEEKEKYKNKDIDAETIEHINNSLAILERDELYRNPNVTLSKIAEQFNIPTHLLSQYLNNNLNKSFSSHINELRVKKAQELMLSNNAYTIEGVGYESGFNSKSTFFTVFKKVTGKTPSQYKNGEK